MFGQYFAKQISYRYQLSRMRIIAGLDEDIYLRQLQEYTRKTRRDIKVLFSDVRVLVRVCKYQLSENILRSEWFQKRFNKPTIPTSLTQAATICPPLSPVLGMQQAPCEYESHYANVTLPPHLDEPFAEEATDCTRSQVDPSIHWDDQPLADITLPPHLAIQQSPKEDVEELINDWNKDAGVLRSRAVPSNN